jgi:Uri superfamily endonuclease
VSGIARVILEPGFHTSGWIEELPTAGGTYVLGLRLAHEQEIRVGRLGTFAFPAGWYAYVGSALAGLRPRLERHLRAQKALHWHIDYLLARAELCEIWFVVSPERLECRWAHLLAGLPGVGVPVSRFGASDCRCPAHLVYWREAPAPDEIGTAILGWDPRALASSP